MGFLAVHAAVLDEVAGLTVLELHRVGFLAAVGARVSWSHVEWLEAQLGSSSSPDRAVVKGLLSVWRLDTHGIFCICLHSARFCHWDHYGRKSMLDVATIGLVL